MRYLYVTLIVLLALLSSCDRYKHDYAAPVVVNYNVELFTPLQSAFSQSNASNLNPVMAFYADDYMHFGVSRCDWELELRTMITGIADPLFEVTMSNALQQNETNAIANWRLKISNPDSKAVIADSTFVGERLVKRNGKWLLKGNQMTCVPPAGKQLVIAEYFTKLDCAGCPIAEAKLKELESLHPNNFIYIEQHTGYGLQVTGDTTPGYYTAVNLPTTVFNGMEKVVGSSATYMATYQNQVEALIQVDTPIRYQVHSSPVVNGRDVSCSVQLTKLVDLDQTDMVLNYVIIEEESPHANYTAPTVKLHNVMQAKGSISLNGVNLANPVNINLTSTRDLPEDIRLIVFAQNKPVSFANNSTIYGGINIPLTRKGAK